MTENENTKNVTAETEITEKSNRGFKNSMFVDLFYEDESAKENDIALYNALHDEPLPEGTEIQKVRIDNILYMNFKNDISFGVGGKLLIFGEHQSTINENLPLRNLMYIGRAYEQIVPVKQRYRKKLIKLPRSEFYTFYNGKENLVLFTQVSAFTALTVRKRTVACKNPSPKAILHGFLHVAANEVSSNKVGQGTGTAFIRRLF